MGVKLALRWVDRAPESKDHPRAVINVLRKALESLEGRNFSKWKVTCTVLKPKAEGGAKDFFLVQFSDHPTRQYLILRQERQALEADSSAKDLLEKLGAFMSPFVHLFEGSCFMVGDFVVKLGRAHTSTNEYRGIVAEVEYRPLTRTDIAKPVMDEFTAILQQAIATQQAETLSKNERVEQCLGRLEVVHVPLDEFVQQTRKLRKGVA
uniref:Mediator of RNA polymerase II transcription subunit 20 n=1 Tax=Tetraselmis sp. GSL018 TaxID=582737 RepID=A0A061SBW7_9CHLO|eukprot:CAMPEP_0177594908 /NCGR_PEP_ID=MMETSP0419_2-20121207/10047_1 /TAXON_ID=582737 /ORGANISM="Tetraselmis sp., Strain GSL018" /LENGTH=207 /DNA_ID=CAMNT_0019086279 /DNA_START=112 /DNA_END=735 /DNA_ORIENTATION=-